MANNFEEDYWNDDYVPDPDVFESEDEGTDFIMQYDYGDNRFVNDDCGCRIDSTLDDKLPDEVEAMDEWIERGFVDVIDGSPDPNLYPPEDYKG
ncbi:MAG: hypothetical protein LIO77_07275 [Rikenellaceae bacterium]|nr:hypothetical protein [Rikenellaceae bacterium]